VSLPPFQTLLDLHGRDVHRFLVASVGRVEADDCYQETWLAALRAYPQLHNAANLRGWLLTIAHRKAIDSARARNRRAVTVPELPEPAAAAAGVDREGEGEGELWAAVRELPAKQRMAISLRYALDADYATVARTMEISEEAARRNVHEGLKRLRTEYLR